MPDQPPVEYPREYRLTGVSLFAVTAASVMMFVVAAGMSVAGIAMSEDSGMNAILLVFALVFWVLAIALFRKRAQGKAFKLVRISDDEIEIGESRYALSDIQGYRERSYRGFSEFDLIGKDGEVLTTVGSGINNATECHHWIVSSLIALN